MACVNADYQFIYADVGCQGRISDGGVFKYTSLYEKLERKRLRLPPDQPLAEGRIPVPYLFVGDDAFALSRYLLKSYPGNLERSSPERIFNYRLCRARRIVENVFGILASKFRVFLKPIGLHPDKVESVTLTCIYLHNFLRRNVESRNAYSPPGTFDTEDVDNATITAGSWRAESNAGEGFIDLQNIPRRSTVDTQNIRREFRDYFVSAEGRIPWQDNYA